MIAEEPSCLSAWGMVFSECRKSVFYVWVAQSDKTKSKMMPKSICTGWCWQKMQREDREYTREKKNVVDLERMRKI